MKRQKYLGSLGSKIKKKIDTKCLKPIFSAEKGVQSDCDET